MAELVENLDAEQPEEAAAAPKVLAALLRRQQDAPSGLPLTTLCHCAAADAGRLVKAVYQICAVAPQAG